LSPIPLIDAQDFLLPPILEQFKIEPDTETLDMLVATFSEVPLSTCCLLPATHRMHPTIALASRVLFTRPPTQ
jgi:hypothetical protein